MLQLQSFIDDVNRTHDLSLSGYDDLHSWSINCSKEFWAKAASFLDVRFTSPYNEVMVPADHPIDTQWFVGGELNYAQNLLKHSSDKTAVLEVREGAQRRISYKELSDEVSKFEQLLISQGIQKGDRVAAILPNHTEAIIAYLACASIGAVWSSCAPEFGTENILARFIQINPKALLFKPEAVYGGKTFDHREKISHIWSQLSDCHILINADEKDVERLDSCQVNWANHSFSPKPLRFEPMSFRDPLAILFSSGTTGKPKCIVHSVGGTLIQHLKELVLHCNLNQDDVFGYYTNCGWMMWNWMVSSLAIGLTLVVFDGSCFYPKKLSLWDIVSSEKLSVFGTSAAYIGACDKLKLIPNETYDFSHLQRILSTGSPLLKNHYEFIESSVSAKTQVHSISGGTDIISCFVLGNPLEPVQNGYIQCRGLGMDVHSVNEQGERVTNEKGELVCRNSFPSMPIYFWNDQNNEKYLASYYDVFPGIWAHGDYLMDVPGKGLQILGRSDTTLNPKGVRIGSSEIYEVVEALEGIDDSIVVGHSIKDEEEIILFVKLSPGSELTPELKKRIKQSLKQHASPRHVPYKIVAGSDIPYTFSGKKVEKAIKKQLAQETVSNLDSIRNPDCLTEYVIA